MKLKAIIFFVIIVTILTPLYAQSEDDFEVRQNSDNTLTITGYRGTEKNVVIPDTLYGLRVTVIAARAFYNKGLISVIISNSVITIEVDAFSSNNELIRVVLGNNLQTIGDRAFYSSNSLTEITIPNSVTRIGNSAFSGNSKIKNVNFGTGIQSIGFDAFYNNEIVELILPSSLTEIGERAFKDNNITKLTLGTGLRTIREEVFCNNKITEIILPSSVREINYNAFADNQIQSIIIPNGVTSLGVGAFANNWIESITIPNSVTSLGGVAFRNNPLINVVITNSQIANYEQAFGNINNNKITYITIPARMNENTLRRNFEVSFVNFWINQNREGGTYIKRGPIWTRGYSENGVIFNEEKTTLLFYPREISGPYTVPNSVTSIGNSAFYSCYSLTSINIPNSVTSIDDSAFHSCYNLTSINIPNNVKSIGRTAFTSCYNLTSINIPNSITSIGDYAFAYCRSITSIEVESDNPFYKSLNGILYNKDGSILIQYPAGRTGSFTIPDGVIIIGYAAFAENKYITNVNIPSTINKINDMAFIGCSSLTSVIIPASCNEIGISAFSYTDSRLTSVIFEGNISANNFLTSSWFTSPFPGDLQSKYLARDGGPGTYTRSINSNTWVKQR